MWSIIHQLIFDEVYFKRHLKAGLVLLGLLMSKGVINLGAFGYYFGPILTAGAVWAAAGDSNKGVDIKQLQEQVIKVASKVAPEVIAEVEAKETTENK